MNEAINPKDAVGRLKPQLHAIPPSALIALGLAMENGEGKYGLMNWRDKAVIASVYYDAAQRHLLSWWDGENIDGENSPDEDGNPSGSGIHHLAHVMACCAIMIDAEITSSLSDDRPAGGPTAEMIAHLHQQRTDESLLGAVGEALQMPPDVAGDPWPWPPLPESTIGIDTVTSPFWKRIFNRKKEPEMATELETIAAAVARSEASSEKTLALVQSFGVKLENIRASTTDANTGAQLLALANSLNAESDKVDAGEVAGEAELADPTPAPTDPSTPAPPADNDHVADGASSFPTTAPADPTSSATQSQPTDPVTGTAPVDNPDTPPVADPVNPES